MAHSFSVCLKSQIHCLFERVGAELLFVLIRCSRVLKNTLQAFERDIALVVKFLCLVSSFVESSLDIGFGFLLGGVNHECRACFGCRLGNLADFPDENRSVGGLIRNNVTVAQITLIETQVKDL